VVAFQVGKASKPSISKDNLLNIQEELTKLGYSLHVIDSERKVDDISLSMFDNLLDLAEELGGKTIPVFTIPVRRGDFEERLSGCLEILKKHNVGGVCIVAGNPAYLDDEELAKPVRPLLVKAAEVLSREATQDGKLLMIGTENVERIAAYISSRYGAIPFTLLDDGKHGELKWFREKTGMPVAVYAPYHVGNPLSEQALNRARAYAARRLHRDYDEDAVRMKITQVAILGDVERVGGRLEQLAGAGASIIVGYPLDDGIEQLRKLAEVIHFWAAR